MDHQRRVKEVRISSAVLLRLIEVAAMLDQHGVPYAFRVPWAPGSVTDIRTFPSADCIKGLPPANFEVDGETTYQVATRTHEMMQLDNIDDVLTKIVCELKGDPIDNHKAILK